MGKDKEESSSESENEVQDDTNEVKNKETPSKEEKDAEKENEVEEEKPKKSKSKDEGKNESKKESKEEGSEKASKKKEGQKSSSSSFKEEKSESKSPKASKKKTEDSPKIKSNKEEADAQPKPKSDGKKKPKVVDDGKSLKEGWLEKKGVKRHSWMKRYFVLKKGELHYFKDDKQPIAKGIVSLTNVTLYAHVEKKGEEMAQYFNIRTPTRDYLIRAADIDEKLEWIRAIKDQITKDKSSSPAPKRGVLKQHSFLGVVKE